MTTAADSAPPTLSVIIPCFNGRAFVCDAVRSVVDDPTPGVECIVVDDGSTDGSAALVEATFGARVAVVAQPNAGVAAARNRGVAASRGGLVIWLDADDVLVPGTIGRRCAAFAADPSLEFLVGQVTVTDVDTGVSQQSPQRCDDDYLYRDLLNRTNLPHHNVLTFRRAALDRIGLHDTSFRTAEDYDLWIRAWAELRWRFVREPFAVQRIGSFLSLTRSETRFAMYEQVGRALRKNRALIARVAGSDTPWTYSYARYAADFALLYLLSHYRSSARTWARAAWSTGDPDTRKRAVRYFLEASLPAPAYRAGRATLKRLGLVRSA